MKKILIAAFIIMQSQQSMANEDYYFKIGVGEAYNPRTRGKVVKGTLSSSRSAVGYVGAGVGVNKYVRAELSFHSGISVIGQATGNIGMDIQGFNGAKEKHKTTSHILLSKLEQDLIDFGYGKFYTSFGIGVARVTDRVRVDINANNSLQSYNSKSKGKINPAYTLGFGSGFYLNEGVLLDISYSYINAGETKEQYSVINNTKVEVSRITVSSHNLTAGFRVVL